MLRVKKLFLTTAFIFIVGHSTIFLETTRAASDETPGRMPEQSQKCLKQVCVPLSRQIAETPTALKGLEKFTYWGFDLYTAALYTPAGLHTSEQILDDTPKSLVLYYSRKIRKDQIITAGDHNLRKNPGNNMPALEPKLKTFNAAYQTVDKGDRYELRYEPGKGTTLLLNDTPQVVVPGADFQKAYFGIWLSQYPINTKLRDRLLGRK